jgi:hypothetical protein
MTLQRISAKINISASDFAAARSDAFFKKFFLSGKKYIDKNPKNGYTDIG